MNTNAVVIVLLTLTVNVVVVIGDDTLMILQKYAKLFGDNTGNIGNVLNNFLPAEHKLNETLLNTIAQFNDPKFRGNEESHANILNHITPLVKKVMDQIISVELQLNQSLANVAKAVHGLGVERKRRYEMKTRLLEWVIEQLNKKKAETVKKAGEAKNTSTSSSGEDEVVRRNQLANYLKTKIAKEEKKKVEKKVEKQVEEPKPVVIEKKAEGEANPADQNLKKNQEQLQKLSANYLKGIAHNVDSDDDDDEDDDEDEEETNDETNAKVEVPPKPVESESAIQKTKFQQLSSNYLKAALQNVNVDSSDDE